MCEIPEVLGVLGTVLPVATRVDLAVNGVGALIRDFFGVSSTLLLRLLVKLFAVDDSNDLAVDDGVGLTILDLRLAVMNGCRRAA